MLIDDLPKGLPAVQKEISLRRLRPEYLINLIENYFKSIDKAYPTSLVDVIKYRKRTKIFFKDLWGQGNKLGEVTALTKELTTLTDKIMRAVEAGKDASRLQAKFKVVSDKIDEKHKHYQPLNFNQKEFHQLLLIRKDFLFRIKMTSAAASYILTNSFFHFLTKIFVFTFSFLVSFYIGDHIEATFKMLGPIIAKLIPATVIFLTADQLIDWIEQKFLWQRVKYLFKKAVAVHQIESTRE